MRYLVIAVAGLWLSAMATGALAQPRTSLAQPLVPLGLFQLSDGQRDTLRQVRRDFRAEYCDLIGRMQDAQDDIRNLYAQERRDPKRIGQTFRSLSILQQRLIEARVAAENRAEAALSEEQRKKLREWRMNAVSNAYDTDAPPYMDPRYPWEQPHIWPYQAPRQYPYPSATRAPIDR